MRTVHLTLVGDAGREVFAELATFAEVRARQLRLQGRGDQARQWEMAAVWFNKAAIEKEF